LKDSRAILQDYTMPSSVRLWWELEAPNGANGLKEAFHVGPASLWCEALHAC